MRRFVHPPNRRCMESVIGKQKKTSTTCGDGAKVRKYANVPSAVRRATVRHSVGVGGRVTGKYAAETSTTDRANGVSASAARAQVITSAACVLIGPNAILFRVDGRYSAAARRISPIFREPARCAHVFVHGKCPAPECTSDRRGPSERMARHGRRWVRTCHEY